MAGRTKADHDNVMCACIDGTANYVVTNPEEFPTFEARIARVRGAATETVRRRTVVRLDLITKAAATTAGSMRARGAIYWWGPAKLELLEAAGADPTRYEPLASEVAARIKGSTLGGIGNPARA